MRSQWTVPERRGTNALDQIVPGQIAFYEDLLLDAALLNFKLSLFHCPKTLDLLARIHNIVVGIRKGQFVREVLK